MSSLSDAAIARLKRLGSWPGFESGRYSVLEEIGRGGMGTVYLARDEELGREVAIKIPNELGGQALERRLQVEARALARLEHPGIVPIHDTGRLADGRLFYVMKRVQGRTLREHLRTVPDLTERLRIFERICEPVAFAHANGCIHRDLKPENVMVGSFGEVMVMDWGIVKVDSRQSSVASRSRQSESPVQVARPSRPSESPVRVAGPSRPSESSVESPVQTEPGGAATDVGVVVGTRGFMAPEQARGAVDRIDCRADVYGLGAILYLLLTNEVPLTGADPLTGLRERRVPRPLAAICAKALAGEPVGRYGSVTALADDVARYRDGRAVEAYRETMVERLARFGRTHRTAILLLLAYIVMRAVVAFIAG